jgi:hypothetical protein
MVRQVRLFAIHAMLACAVFIPGFLYAEDLERTVEFRDGNILTVTLPDATVSGTVRTANGTEAKPLKLSDFEQIVFAKKPHLEDGKRIAGLIEDLGNDDFTTRENAERDLRKAGTVARAEILAAQSRGTDPETEVRINRLLHELPPASDDEIGDGYFDRLKSQSGHAVSQADLGGIAFTAHYRDHEIKLDRSSIAQIRTVNTQAASRPAPIQAKVERITEDVPEAFGKGATRIDFETAPDGTPLTAGMDIGQTFVARGFTLATSYTNSFVSVNNYSVRGPSGGNSCATQNPLWNGIITIRFCVPGQPKVPAGVTAIGFWIAEVSPNGTALEAYDAQDHRIAEIKVIKQGNDFLGVRSTIPIAYIKVVPNLAIDPDYTIDDLVFDTPRPFEFDPHPQLHAVHTRNGDRILAKAVNIAGDKLHLTECSAGIDQLDLNLNELKIVITPQSGWKGAALPVGCWLKLIDGSVLHAGLENGPICTRVPLKLSPQTLAAMWGELGEFIDLPPKTVIPPGGGCYVDRKGSLVFADWKFGKKFIDEPHFTPAGDPDQRWSTVTYQTAATTWFNPEPVVSPDAGRVLLLTGESFVLPEDHSGFSIESWTDRELKLKYGAETVRIATPEVLSISPPGK